MARTIVSEHLNDTTAPGSIVTLVTCGDETALWLERTLEGEWTINDHNTPIAFEVDEDLDEAVAEWLRCVQPATEERLVSAFGNGSDA